MYTPGVSEDGRWTNVAGTKILRPYQQAVCNVFTNNGGVGILGLAAGLGKAQPVDSKILTPSGWKRLGEVSVGDYAIGINGILTRIIGVYPQGIIPVYKVTLSDGSTVECSSDHLWSITSIDRRQRGVPYWVKSTKEILEKPFKNKKGNYYWQLPITSPVKFDDHDNLLPIDPYILGLLLGDGHFEEFSTTLSCNEPEILEEFERRLPKGIRLEAKSNKNQCDYRIAGNPNTLLTGLKELGVNSTRSGDKFVPERYLFATVETRLQMLQGLMDADGWTQGGSHTPMFGTASPLLARDVQFIVQTLGGTSTMVSRGSSYKNPNGEKIQGQDQYRLCISLPKGFCPFLMSRKANSYNSVKHLNPSRGIKSIELVGEKECLCIKVENEDGLYLTDNCIVTHNTPISALVSQVTGNERILVLSLKTGMGTWRRDYLDWTGQHVAIYSRKTRKDGLLAKLPRLRRGVVVTNYSMLAEVLKAQPNWDLIICDEAHRFMRRRTSGVYQLLHSVVRNTKFIPCSGSVISKGPQDAWPMLSLSFPKEYKSYWQFVEKYCLFQDTPFGRKYIGPQNTQQLKAELKHRLIYLSKSDVADELPPKTRQAIEIEMEPAQQKMYDSMANDMIAEWTTDEEMGIEEGVTLSPNPLSKMIRLRQILITPNLFGGPEPSAMLDAVNEQLSIRFDSNQSAIVFTPFRPAVKVLHKWIQKVCDPENIEIVMGGLDEDVIDERVQRFERNPNPRKVIIATIKSGISWTAVSANVVLFAGYELEVDDNTQAEDRTHRQTQTKQVDCLYFIHRGTIDDHLMDILDNKKRWQLLCRSPLDLIKGER